MQDNPNANAAPHREHIEVDADFFNRLADRFTAKQTAQQQEVGNATKTLAGVLVTFYKELRMATPCRVRLYGVATVSFVV